MIDNIRSKALSVLSSRLCLAAVLAFVASCSSIPRAHVEQPPVVIQSPPPEFTIAAGALDTWNAVGQILVHQNGVTYEGRAQMLGLYDVDYRGERFLIVTRALNLTSEIRVTTTQVRTALRDGKPDSSAAAIELLGFLQAQLPEELRLIASSKKIAPVKKRGKRSIRH